MSQLIFYLMQSDDVKSLLFVSSAHEDVGKLVMVLKLSPEVVHNLVAAIRVKGWLTFFDHRHHLFSEESVGRHEFELA